MEARELAARMVGYFERVACGSPDVEVWAKGLKTAQEWLSLIDAPSVSEQELTAFIGVIRVHRWHTSGWAHMAYEVYQWAQAQGIALPPREEFLAHESLSTFEGKTSLERANKLIELFSRNIRDDPDYEPWHKGLSLAQKWLSLMQTENQTEEIVLSFVTDISKYIRKYIDNQWSALIWGVMYWARQLGYADQGLAIMRSES